MVTLHAFLVLAGLTLLAAASTGVAANDENSTLAGLTAVRVVVEEAEYDIEHDGLSQSVLRRELESKLKAAGLGVLTDREWQAAPGRPSLRLEVTVKAAPKAPRLFLVGLDLEQDVRLVRYAGHSGPAPTWSATLRLGVVPPSGVAPVLQAVREAVDEFITAWRGTGPQR